MAILLASGLLLAGGAPSARVCDRLGEPRDETPIWSPDGERIAFVRVLPGCAPFATSVHVVGPDGHNLERVDEGLRRGGPSPPAWLSNDVVLYAGPDGIHKARRSRGVWLDVGRVTSRSGDRAPVVASSSLALAFVRGGELWVGAPPQARVVARGLRADDVPVWSPDGTALAYTGTVNRHPELFVVETDSPTLSPRDLSTTPDLPELNPTWSADSAFVAFATPGYDAPIEQVPRQGGERSRLADLSPAGSPAFSPDGRWLAYEVLDDDYNGLWAISLPGRRVEHQFKAGADSKGRFAWSPDAKLLALARYGDCRRLGIHVFDLLPALAAPEWRPAAQQRISNRCRRVGTDRDETIRGTPFRDVILGYGGNDTLIGRDGDDTLRGGQGNDRIIAGSGNDVIATADDGRADQVSCGPGRDLVYADRSGDTLDRDCERVVLR